MVDDDDDDDDDDEDDDDDGYRYDEGTSKVLFVIDIQSGDILQSVHVDLQGEVSAIRVDGDEIFIAGYQANKVVVLQFAGSEV